MIETETAKIEKQAIDNARIAVTLYKRGRNKFKNMEEGMPDYKWKQNGKMRGSKVSDFYHLKQRLSHKTEPEML